MAAGAMGLTPMLSVISEEGKVEMPDLVRMTKSGLPKWGNAAASAVVQEDDLRTADRDDITGGLGDEEVSGGALEVNVGTEIGIGVSIVHACREVRPDDETGLDVCAIRDGAPSCVGVSRLHVADGCRHYRWRGRDVVYRVVYACVLRRLGISA